MTANSNGSTLDSGGSQTPRAFLLIPLSVRPRLAFVPVDDEASWVISRTVVEGRYRWSARLHLDGVRRSERAEALAEHGRKADV